MVRRLWAFNLKQGFDLGAGANACLDGGGRCVRDGMREGMDARGRREVMGRRRDGRLAGMEVVL